MSPCLATEKYLNKKENKVNTVAIWRMSVAHIRDIQHKGTEVGMYLAC